MVFDAGENLRVRASGLDTELRGLLRVRSRADGELSARGTVEMRSGTYQAFGQKLVIEHGRLTFDGPVRNPGLDVRALRKNQQVEAGVEVRGTLQTPVTRLVSEPPVPDQEKLAWLLLGRSAATAQGAEAALIQAALASLAGSRGGAPIGQGVARRLGLDEVGLRSGLTGGQVLAFGKRIANRIYVEYEQGLTVAAQLVRLKLELTRALNARIEAGPQGGRIGFGYDYSYN
jgi:translocation and assembly module TamB